MRVTSSIQAITVKTPLVRQPPGPEPIKERLKPERVQEMLMAAASWQLLGDTACLKREKTFPDAVSALTYSSLVSSLAASLKVRAGVRLQGSQVTVTLGSLRKGRGPLSEAQVHFAVLIS
ncbi:MAG TPA: hypothetical protein VF173_26480 [Thermoanaerobaculia bacterium]|nr:hypothetical protein [Thermoanaerobaculia bacterium]